MTSAHLLSSSQGAGQTPQKVAQESVARPVIIKPSGPPRSSCSHPRVVRVKKFDGIQVDMNGNQLILGNCLVCGSTIVIGERIGSEDYIFYSLEEEAKL